ncbi:MAG: tRNA (adenosine(37)-N6)-threonylcarbamoyltransferase complex dimerization subunit type 1 TsaB [Acidobacteria bacterium]|nr:tRNA (adenosine(37)-N6)-threonylcarbamoyltransferase complex dimerization subunit type 1 TsaB [Acidobacteriota bacterium]
MLILSLDTTTRAGSVAMVRDGVVVYEQSGDASLTHAQRLPADLMTACRAAGVRITEVGLFAVAAGPGSFTGLRIGIATIQGLALAGNRRVVPVSTLEALAAAAVGDSPRVAAWIDAHRGEVFAQMFDREQGSVAPAGAAISAVAERVLAAHAALIHGAEFHGDGAIRYRQQIAAHRPTAVIADDVPPLAGALGVIAARHPERAVLPHAIVPIYVRRPDAEIARDRRAAGA